MSTPQEVLQQILAQTNPTQNAKMPIQVPGLTTGEPLVADATIRQAIAQALQPSSQFQPSAEDKNNAMLTLGTQLMKPRMPGESVAGNIGAAVSGASTALDQAKAKAIQEAQQRATMASTLATQDLSRRDAQMRMDAFKAKYPLEYQQAVLQLQKDRYELPLAAAKAQEAEFEMDPVRFAERMRLKQESQQLGVNKLGAEVTRLGTQSTQDTADAALKQAQADYWRYIKSDAQGASGRPKITSTAEGVMLQDSQGTHVWSPPMDAKTAEKKAAEDVVRERKAAGRWNFGDSFTDDYAREVAERAKQLEVGGWKLTKPATGEERRTVANSAPGQAPVGDLKKQSSLAGSAVVGVNSVTGLPENPDVAPNVNMAARTAAEWKKDVVQLTAELQKEKNPTRKGALQEQLNVANAALAQLSGKTEKWTDAMLNALNPVPSAGASTETTPTYANTQQIKAVLQEIAKIDQELEGSGRTISRGKTAPKITEERKAELATKKAALEARVAKLRSDSPRI